METLLSVGIDLGTTTTQLVFSRLTVADESPTGRAPSFCIAKKEVLYCSEIHFTPLLSEQTIDTDALCRILDGEYARAGVRREEIQTGAVIITGETARRENAAQVLAALSGYAGDFVVAAAGPALESRLAGIGAGAMEASRAQGCAVLNLDIGGGTTNLARFERGTLVDTGCLNIGGRLMKLRPDGTITFVSPVLAPLLSMQPGQRVRPEALEPLCGLLTRLLEEATGLRPVRDAALLRHFITDRLPDASGSPLLSFSGGVGALLDRPEAEPFAFGDLGVLLARAVASSSLLMERRIAAAQTIRATVIGAGCHSTTLSGSTVFYRDIRFPLKNLPVVCFSNAQLQADSASVARCIASRCAPLEAQAAAVALALPGWKNPRFSELCQLADALAAAHDARDAPLILCTQEDMGKALGQALGLLLPGCPIVCLDGLCLSDGSYLDIGAPIASGQVLPVVIKTLVL